MTITTEITRADFVKQADGSTAWAIEITQSTPDPFDSSKVLRRAVQPAPMTPEMAFDQFGLGFADVVSGINTAQALELAQVKAELLTAQNQLKAAQDEIAELRSTS